MRLLVLGGTLFLGRHLVRTALARGHHVTTFTRGRTNPALFPAAKALHAERRWSQSDLAERIGVSRQTINAIENDRYDPSLPLAFRMSALFERPIEQVFEYQNDDQRD